MKRELTMDEWMDYQKKIVKIFDKIDQCFYADNHGHVGKCKSGETLAQLQEQARKILKKMPILDEDER